MKVILVHGRVCGKRGRGGKGKAMMFGLLKRQVKIYIKIIPDCSAYVLQKIIKSKIGVGSTIYSDGWFEYSGLVDFYYRKHFRMHYGKNKFLRGGFRINRI